MNELLSFLTTEITKRRSPATPFVVAISGIDTSGKSELAQHLALHLMEQGYRIQIIHLDDFHNPRAFRYAGSDEVENYYKRTFDLNLLCRALLNPIHHRGGVKTTLKLLDLMTDQYERLISYEVHPDSIVILEGIFLFRPELRLYLNYKIWLDILETTALERIQTRDVPRFGEAIVAKYHHKYFPAQRLYVKQYPPRRYADLIINTNVWNEPHIVYRANSI